MNGNVEVSDLSLDFPWTNGQETLPWTLGGNPDTTGLVTALDFTGDGAHNASVDRVSVTGRAYTSPAAVSNSVEGFGLSVLQGIMFDGWYPSPPFVGGASETDATVSGSFAVRGSFVQTVWEAVLVQGVVTSSQVTLTGNQLTNVGVGFNLGAANSTFDVSGNTVAADVDVSSGHAGVYFVPSGFASLVSSLSQASIHDNAIEVSDVGGSGECPAPQCMMEGIWLWDAPPSSAHWLRATVTHNTISLPPTYTYPGFGQEGIDANNITGTTISGNTITGTPSGAWDAISLWGNDPSFPPATGNVIMGNNVSGFAPMGPEPYPDNFPGLGLSQYYLDPYTTHNLVMCTNPKDTAYDGSGTNVLIHCTTPTVPPVTPGVTPNVSPASSLGRLKLPRLLP